VSTKQQSVLKAVRDYYNDPSTVHKFTLWAPDPRRPGITAAHLGLDDVERFHRDIVRFPLELRRHRKAVERMTRLIAAESQVENGHRVLDAGCGTGSITFPIAEQNPRARLFPVSLSRSQLEIAHRYRQSAGIRNVFPSEQNFTRTAFRDASFDRVFFAESFCHAPDKPATIAEAARILKPGGKLLIVDPLYLRPLTPDLKHLSRALGSTEGLAMADLLTFEELIKCFEDEGLEMEFFSDLTTRAKPSLALIANGYVQALREGRAKPSALIDSYLAWYLLTEQGPLGYVLVRAVKA
jgi:SAM-dependent methyltransferase